MAKRRRGGGHAEHANHERWLLTYADLITLLVVFFIVMYSMSLTDQRKFIALSGSIAKAFNVGVLEGGTTVLEGFDSLQLDSSFISQTQKSDYAVIKERLTTLVKNEGAEGTVELNTTQDGTVIRLAGSLLFPSGRAELRPESTKVLEGVAQMLRSYPNRFRIEGHTDDLPPTLAEYPTNLDLSVARSQAVNRFLVNTAKLPQDRISIAGYGEFKPLVPNADTQSRMKNRRADIVILYEPQPAIRSDR